jgi:hypothetical protein
VSVFAEWVAAVNASNLTSLPTSNPLTSEQIAKLAASANQLTREEIADFVKRGRELTWQNPRRTAFVKDGGGRGRRERCFGTRHNV